MRYTQAKQRKVNQYKMAKGFIYISSFTNTTNTKDKLTRRKHTDKRNKRKGKAQSKQGANVKRSI